MYEFMPKAKEDVMGADHRITIEVQGRYMITNDLVNYKILRPKRFKFSVLIMGGDNKQEKII